jgi:hypothetical protein
MRARACVRLRACVCVSVRVCVRACVRACVCAYKRACARLRACVGVRAARWTSPNSSAVASPRLFECIDSVRICCNPNKTTDRRGVSPAA